ncbi:MAG: Ig-like domain-containing protein [Acidimicrobiales bacterium]
MGRPAVAIGAVIAMVMGFLAGLAGTAGAVSPNVVVSQLYGGGGNTGAPFTNDFVELFNRGAAPVDLTGWSVQYASATGTGTFAGNGPVELSGMLQPGQYHLVQMGGGTVGAPLPPPDTIGGILMAAGAGKGIVASTAQGLACNGGSDPCSADELARIVDLVGYGNANFFEGAAAAPTLSNTTAGHRATLGCTDTDQNGADFAASAPAPRTTASPLGPCGGDAPPAVASTTPADGAAGVATGANVSVTFTEAVDVTGDWFTITCAVSGAHPAAVGGGPTTFSLDPVTDFSEDEACSVTVVAAAITDQDGEDPPDAMAADFTFDFTTTGPPIAIHDIQGASHTSPRAGTSVSTLPAIVTAKLGNGFYLQDPAPDADVTTSEAIFVFTSSAPAVNLGDEVTVGGTVTEFRPGGAASDNLTLTEIASPTISVLSTGNPLPATTVIGNGGRVPPATVIDDDSFADFDPATDGIDFYESLESMRVQINDAVATGPTNNFGEVSVVGDNGANAGPRTARGGVVVTPGDFNPERVFLDDTIVGPTPVVNVGDGFTAPAVGIMDYSFGNYKLYLTSPLTGVDRGLVRETTRDVVEHELSVATFNVENLNPNDPAAKFEGLADVVVEHLRSPDIVALEEIQDNNGTENDAVTDANLTLGALVAAIEDAGGPTYDHRQINPVDDQDGGAPGGNIRVGFLFRTDTGVEFVDRPGGDPTTPVDAVAGADGPELTLSPGRVDPLNPAWTSSRKPLAAEFLLDGETFFVIVNHFNSKGGDDPLFGRTQPPVRVTDAQRAQQAAVLNGFIDSILDLDPHANVVALGDFNDFEFSDALEILLADDLTDLIDTLPPEEQYGYVFEGNSQTLDHILVSAGAADRLSAGDAYDVVHVNAEFAVQTSDHDPSVSRFLFNQAPTIEAGGPYPVAEGGSVTLTAVADDGDGDPVTVAWDLDGDGTFETPGASVTFPASAIDGPATLMVGVQASDGFTTAVDVAMVDVANVAPAATFNAPATAPAGFPFMLSLTDPADPSAPDVAAGFRYAFDCGRGSGYGPFSASNTASCSTSDVGSRSVRAMIRDKDGGTTEYVDTVTVNVTFDSLCDLTRAYSNDPAVSNVLCAILDAAEGIDHPTLRQIVLAGYRLVVALETGNRPRHAFTPAEGSTLQRLSRAL